MSIRVTCGVCGGELKAPDAAAGKRGRCPQCKSSFVIPTVSTRPKPRKLPPENPSANPVAEPEAVLPSDPDVEILNDPPAAVLPPVPPVPRFPVPPAPQVPVAPVPPVPVAPVPAHPVSPVPQPTANPFAFIGPPPNSAAAKLRAHGPDEDAPRRPPLHPGWEAVVDGLGSLRRSALIGMAVAGLGAFVYVASIFQSSFAFLAFSGMLVLAAITALVFHVIGLLRCMKMPAPEEGGAGRMLAQIALVLTIAGVVLSPCLIGAVALLALPFVLGMFLRGIGQELPDRLTAVASVRAMAAAGGALLVGLLAVLAIALIVPLVLGPDIRKIQLVGFLLSFGSAAVQCVAIYLYLVALGHAERAVRSAVRTRGILASEPEDAAPRESRPPEVFDEAPTPLATMRPPSGAKAARDARR